MEISSQVREIISVLSAYARNGLREAEMLAHFLQHAAEREKQEALGELSFTAKYLTRVQSAIRRQTPESELYTKLEEEFSYGVHSFHAKVKDFVSDAEDDFRGMAERHLLTVSQDALHHLVGLAEDFAWLKNWELEMTQGAGADTRDGTDG
ncbi:MAG: hypothetical protein RRA94_02130 [Bacteroidota bacterium]|nr:hypothetical protein [Bacteroidota bacterium]